MEWQATIIEFRDKGKLEEFKSEHIFEIDSLEIKDSKSLERVYVNAQICKDETKLPDGDVLWVLDYREKIIPQPRRIKILKKLPGGYESYL